MGNHIYTIGREFGSGGKEIGVALANRLGVKCYDKELLKEASKESGYCAEIFENHDEKPTNSFLYSVYMLAQTAAGKGDMLTNDGHIYVREQAVIKQLAAKGSAIFLGHCAAEALKEYEGMVRVFIRCSDEEAKRQRIMEEYGIDAGKVEAVRKKFDKKRANYYYANTVKKWDDFKNYELVLDSGKLGKETCVKMLCALVR